MASTVQLYSWLADTVLLAHFAFVLFVIAGFLLIWIGYVCRWGFVRNIYFRLAHLLAMGVVVAEAGCGLMCPLTTWEQRLRMLAGGGQTYAGSFMQHWIHRILFYDAPEYIFTAIYTLFFGLVILSLWLVKPRWPGRHASLP